MKIRNDIVSIKIGKKQYDFNNLILNEYLKIFARSQLDSQKLNFVNNRKSLSYCLLKFDEPLVFDASTELHNQDFDICFVGGATYNQFTSENQIITEYTYDTKWSIWDYNKATASDITINNYYGKKITAIGFNVYWTSDKLLTEKHPVCAILDTSNQNLYLQANQELSITRRDIITTDALFYSSNINKVSGPVHLMPYGVQQIIYQPNIYNDGKTAWHSFNDRGYGILYSIGLSSYSNYIDKEFIIGQDIQIQNNGIELEINGLENYLTSDSSLFCSSNLYPNSNVYPVKSNYRYVIFKYKIWQMVHSGTYGNTTATPADTGIYYYQAIPISKFGKSKLKIKYERG